MVTIGADKAISGARNADEMVPYEGNRSHEPDYNFCYLCKERLETVQDESDECWYFVNTKQIRYSTAGADSVSKTVNVHSGCLLEIEQQGASDKSEVKAD